MENGKKVLGLLATYGLLGVATGLLFGRAQYHKGQADAYEDITEDLTAVINEVQEFLDKQEEEA